MVKKFINGLFAPRKRAIIITHTHPEDGKLYVLTHKLPETFVLQKYESVATAARFILRQGFRHINQETDIHTFGFKQFEQDGVVYHIVCFDEPVLPEQDVDGYEKLQEAGFGFTLIGDHELSPRINEAIGRI